MSAPVITERHIDKMYTIIEMLSLSKTVLEEGNVSAKTSVSLAWLLGQTCDQAGEILTLVEGLQKAQAAEVAEAAS